MHVSSDIRAICRKCGDVWHVVVAMADGKIAKVECRECGAGHRYRPGVGASAGKIVSAAVAEKKPAAARKTPARPRKSSKVLVVEADPSRPPRPFSTSESYRAGDRVVHATFGEGVVQAVKAGTKVEVLFDAGSKTLVHGRATA